MTLPYSLQGRTALVTGASSGIGEHLAKLFGAAGANVVVGARRLERTQSVADEIIDAGGQALAVSLDVTDEASIVAAYGAAEDKFGVVDTVLANAGFAFSGRTTELESASVASLVNTNIMGVYMTAREGAKRLIESGSRETEKGRIILVGSITAHMNYNHDVAYSASKAAVAHMARNMAREWIRQGVNVNTISPGYIDTEINGDWFEQEGGKAQIAAFHRRRIMELTALDDMMLYLASDASKAITGAEFIIDDGQSL